MKMYRILAQCSFVGFEVLTTDLYPWMRDIHLQWFIEAVDLFNWSIIPPDLSWAITWIVQKQIS